MNKNTSVDLDKSRLKDALIVSYSYSGNTHQIAKAIQTITGADWSEIYPWQPYPVEFPELLEQVQREVRNGYKPRLLPNARSPKQYAVVFVGSPNWCGTISPPLASWLSRHDLSGKVILPFYSHCGGVAGDLAGDIAALCPKADVREALGVIGSGGDDLSAALTNWMDQAKKRSSQISQSPQSRNSLFTQRGAI